MKNALAGLLGLAAVAAAAPAVAQDGIPSGAYQNDPTHTTITFSVDHLGLAPYVMRFERFEVALVLDADNPVNSSVTATIDPTSISSPLQDGGGFDGELAGPGFLDAGAFPTIDFVSTSVEMTSDTTAIVTGDLTLLGQTQSITMDVELTGAIDSHPFTNTAAVGFVATGSFDRTAFGSTNFVQEVGNGASIVSPTVDFTITAEFSYAE